MSKRELANLLDDIFVPIGFKRKGNNWVQNSEELSKIVNIQKSNFGELFYVNYDFIIKELPLSGKSHVPHRLASADREEQKLITELLDFDANIPLEDRLSQLRKLIKTKIVTLMQSIRNEQDLHCYLKARSHLYDVPLVVKQHFKLDS